MEKLIEEYIGILNGDEPASHKFWRVEERTRQDKREPGVIITEMSRSKMRLNLLRLLDHSVITLNDLEGFSEELREDLCHVAKIWASESDTE